MATKTRTDTKRQWHRERLMRYGLPERMGWSYDWLRIAIKELVERRDPDPAVRAARAELGPALATAGASYLLECARRLDDAIPSSATDAWEARENARRDRMATAYAAATTEREQLRFAADWARSSAKQLSKCQNKYTLSAVAKADCLSMLEQVTDAASEYLMALAERAEAGGVTDSDRRGKGS